MSFLNYSFLYYLYATVNEWNEEKYLHYYIKDYNKIYSTINKITSKQEIYYEYITHVNDLYGKCIEDCCT